MMQIKNPYLSFVLIFVLFAVLERPTVALTKPYIIYFGGHTHGLEPSLDDMDRAENSHHEFLASFLGSKEKARDSIIYAHTKHINAFSARLEEEEAEKISKHPDVISIFESKGHELQTTRVWEFLGLEKNGETIENSLWQKANLGEDIILANVDNGLWVKSKSFSDEGLNLGPIPSRWKGQCQNPGDNEITCNRKLISVRKFYKGFADVESVTNVSSLTIAPTDGHGTHTLSTAGGAFVAGANSFGYGNGTIKGGAPRARLAHYKVCWLIDSEMMRRPSCIAADVLAGIEEAVHDGVDVLNISIDEDLDDPPTLVTSYTSIGGLHAFKKGTVVVAAAGNAGPTSGTTTNTAPWIITVGASTLDREFTAELQLGDNQRLKGYTGAHEVLPENKLYPLINAQDAKLPGVHLEQMELCSDPSSLNATLIKGKIVACSTVTNWDVMGASQQLKNLDAAGMISFLKPNPISEAEAPSADSGSDAPVFSMVNYGMPAVLPAIQLSASDGLAVLKYINSTKSPVAYIETGKTVLNVKPAPVVGSFSSRGPSSIPEILKPDIIAPGVHIIASTVPTMDATDEPEDTRRTNYVAMWGTSMATPVVAGVAALLKGIHRDWSPSAIKSALMTTAYVMDNSNQTIRDYDGKEATPFGRGAGHIDPNKAMDPGLVYDLTFEDHLNFLCGTGFSSTEVSKVSGDDEHKNFQCPKSYNLLDYNYPTITVPNLSNPFTVVSRTLKNVGTPGTYKVEVVEPTGVSVKVDPESLKFEKVGEEKVFKVTLTAKQGANLKDYTFGSLVWSDGVHNVRSQISVKQ